jgi:hypothetical protein
MSAPARHEALSFQICCAPLVPLRVPIRFMVALAVMGVPPVTEA